METIHYFQLICIMNEKEKRFHVKSKYIQLVEIVKIKFQSKWDHWFSQKNYPNKRSVKGLSRDLIAH